ACGRAVDRRRGVLSYRWQIHGGRPADYAELWRRVYFQYGRAGDGEEVEPVRRVREAVLPPVHPPKSFLPRHARLPAATSYPAFAHANFSPDQSASTARTW